MNKHRNGMAIARGAGSLFLARSLALASVLALCVSACALPANSTGASNGSRSQKSKPASGTKANTAQNRSSGASVTTEARPANGCQALRVQRNQAALALAQAVQKQNELNQKTWAERTFSGTFVRHEINQLEENLHVIDSAMLSCSSFS